jgi:hypothetical protein
MADEPFRLPDATGVDPAVIALMQGIADRILAGDRQLQDQIP